MCIRRLLALQIPKLLATVFCILFALTPFGRAKALEAQVLSSRVVARGWHPWYEVKADPEDPRRLMVCGSKWNAKRNALYGFVYVSTDAGANWQGTLEDDATPWVSEQSCTFGPQHVAYFVSGA